MRGDRKIIRAYLADYGNWLENPIAAIGYPQEVKLTLNIYDTFTEPDIRKIYRDVTGKDAPNEDDRNFLDKEKEFREANHIKSKETQPKRRPRFPWFDLHTQMNELNKITFRLEDRLQYILIGIFKDLRENDDLAAELHLSVKTVEVNIGEMYDRVAEGIRDSKNYRELFGELYHYDKPRHQANGLRQKRIKRKRKLKIPGNVKTNFPSTLALK